MPGPAGIEAHGFGWRHAGRRAWALHDLDLRVEPGERVLLLGPSGSGKSTLLAGLAGVLGGDDEGDATGELRIDGRLPAEARGRAGLVLQDPESQLVMARVGDDVAFGCENLGVPRAEIWRRVHDALDAVGLDVALDRSTSALSGGQKQRLALAGALAMRPGLLLLDEPTANLDPDGAREVRDAVGRVLARTGATLVVVEHRVDLWLPIVDRVVVLDAHGGIVADGPAETVLADHGARLAQAGVWVPDHEPEVTRRAGTAPRIPLLEAESLDVARVAGRPLGHRVDLVLAGGETLAVTGPNGVGKTTLALTLAGLLPPAGGLLRATPALADGSGMQPHRWRSRDLLTRVGTVFQTPEHQFLAGTVRDELAVGPRALGLPSAEVDARADALLDRLGLSGLAAANPFTLSGGQKRRLSVGTVLATRPRVVVLDEPTFGQDAVSWARLVDLLDEVRADGCALVAATHDERFTAGAATGRLALTSGRDAAEAA